MFYDSWQTFKILILFSDIRHLHTIVLLYHSISLIKPYNADFTTIEVSEGPPYTLKKYFHVNIETLYASRVIPKLSSSSLT